MAQPSLSRSRLSRFHEQRSPLMRRGTNALSRDVEVSSNSDEGSSSTQASPEAARRRWLQRDHSALICALSNLSIQYNFTAVTVALALMQHPELPPSSPHAAYPRSLAQESLLKSLVFAGAVVGQLVMGYAGDAVGRRRAMALTNLLTVLGALGSALLTWGEAASVYSVLMACRFVLGVGVGGKYPLAATIRAEACTEGDAPLHSATEVAKGFFWQTPGAMLPYAVGLLVLHWPSSSGSLAAVSLQFRLVLGLGAVPALLVMCLCYFQALGLSPNPNPNPNPNPSPNPNPNPNPNPSPNLSAWK